MPGHHDGDVSLLAHQQVMRRLVLAISYHFSGAVVRQVFRFHVEPRVFVASVLALFRVVFGF